MDDPAAENGANGGSLFPGRIYIEGFVFPSSVIQNNYGVCQFLLCLNKLACSVA
jgi:hypothetical protein